MRRSSRSRPTALTIERSPEYDQHRLAVACAAALPFMVLASAVATLLGMG
jgi:hypothetical protein